MKGDFSRSTFQPRKHYRSVLMQQGRVQMDADWNEQLEIDQHVSETMTTDSIGTAGVPDTGGGFRIDARPDGGDLLISPGRAYVDGILCENEAPIAYEDQFSADLPDATKAVSVLAKVNATVGIVFLDVWKRQITALEDPAIREVALGGPDHATRSKVVWQVKVLPLTGVSVTASAALTTLLGQRLAAAAALRTAETAAGANVPQLQNQLDAVDGAIELLTAANGVRCGMVSNDWNKLITPPSGQLTARIRPGQAPTNPCELLPLAGFQRLENQLYRVEVHAPGALGAATFKWSRENGSVATAWVGQDALNLRVASTGRDAPLGFAPGAQVELTDDTRELLSVPGIVVQVDKVEGNVITIKPPPSTKIKIEDFPRNPKLRRWDQPTATVEPVQVPTTNDGFIPLEGGVEVKFSGTQFNTGDYWLIPARTAIGDSEIGGIEWPRTPAGTPLAQSPAGVEHHFARLALVALDAAGKLHVVADCRDRMPALTSMAKLQYLGGDGQEGPGGQALGQPLRAGVSIGSRPLAGALVRFRVVVGGGTLTGGLASIDVVTNDAGVAQANWTLDGATPTQVVEAQLLNGAGQPGHLPIRYSARIGPAAGAAVLHIKDLGVIANPLLVLRNETVLLAGELAGGLRLVCDAPVQTASLPRSLSVYVTLFVPFPLGGESTFWGTSVLVGFHPIVLDGLVRLAPTNETHIEWAPTGSAAGFLQNFFSKLPGTVPAVPVRLTVKGNFILPKNPPFLSLDAEALLDGTNPTIKLPTGRGRPGSDLELYFFFARQRGYPITFSTLQARGVFEGVGGQLV